MRRIFNLPPNEFAHAARENLVTAFKPAFFQPDVAAAWPAKWWQIASFGTLTVLIPLLYELAANGISGRVDWEAVPSAIAHIPVILLAVIVTAYVLGSSDKTLSLFRSFLMIAMAIDPPHDVPHARMVGLTPACMSSRVVFWPHLEAAMPHLPQAVRPLPTLSQPLGSQAPRV